jgi:regulator of RNase E activity RraA
MSLYIVRRPADGRLPTRRFGRAPILFELDPAEQIDIDNPADLAFAETVAAGRRAAEVTRFRAMRSHLSSTVLADIMKAHGQAAVLAPGLRAEAGATLFGRAKTLQLAALAEHARGDWQGIYGALDSYRFVRPGDVIMVATDCPERAYFGDLNANLAIRAGAVGAVIDGATRDGRDVRALGLPVFARDRHCDDIKYEGTLAAMNRPVVMGGIRVCNDDIVFGDEDGVVVIPAALWPEVEAEAWEVLATEARIRHLAARGHPTDAILAECGSF